MADLPPADPEDDAPEPPRLRALRRLVTLLTATLIVGVIVVVAALVIRLARPPAAAGFDARAVTAARLALPADEAPVAAGGATGALIVITRDAQGIERMRFFDAATGEPTAVVLLNRR